MKHLYLIGGTMGVGKTTVCRHLQKQLDRCVFLDGEGSELCISVKSTLAYFVYLTGNSIRTGYGTGKY